MAARRGAAVRSLGQQTPPVQPAGADLQPVAQSGMYIAFCHLF